MSFLDKAREKATQLTQQAKEKIDDIKDTRKADDLLEALGAITYRQHTARAEPGDGASIAELVAQLQVLEAEGTTVVEPEPAADAEPHFPPPASPSAD